MTEQMNLCVLDTCQETMRHTMELNIHYHSHEKIVRLMSNIIGKEIDDSFNLFPPFYADFGRNIHIGKHVFINSFCNFSGSGWYLHW